MVGHNIDLKRGERNEICKKKYGFVGTDALINSWKFHIDLLQTVATVQLGKLWEVGSFDLLWWPDLTRLVPFFSCQTVCSKFLGKVTKYELDISRRLRMAQENLIGPLSPPPLARNRVKSQLRYI